MLRAVRREAKLDEQIGNVFLVSLSGRISLGNDLIQLRFGVLASRTKTVVPDIEWLEWTAQPSLNQPRSLRHQRRTQHLLQHGFYADFRNLAIFLESPVDQRRRGRRIRIGFP